MPSIPQIQHELTQRDEQEWENPNWRLSDLKLESNAGGAIGPDQVAWLRPISADASDEEIRRELETKGVVHVKGVMPREMVLDMRRKWFEHVAPCGILKNGTEPVDGIYCGDAETNRFVGPDNAGYLKEKMDKESHFNLALEAHGADWSETFASNEALRHMVQRLRPSWTSPSIFRRQLYRANVPFAKGTSTGVHYDHIFLRGGPPTALTVWVPIGDCSPLMGGLMYLENSMTLGEKQEEEFDRLCQEKGMSPEERLSAFNSNMNAQGMLSLDAADFARGAGGGRRWLIGDYEAGDAVFHHSYMVHASGVNVDPQGRIRLSADLRFADNDQPHEPRWCNPYALGDGL